MKTTIEIPDDLARRIKIRAIERRQKLKETFAELLEEGLAKSTQPATRTAPPKPVRLKSAGILGIDDIEAAIIAGRD